MTGRVAMIDGALVVPKEARVSIYDRGFLYGDAIFEVLRTYRGIPFALDEHMRHLERSAERVALRLPVSRETFGREIERAVAHSGIREAYVRVMVTRGSGPLKLDPEEARDPVRVVLVEPVVPPSRDAYAAGIAVITVHTRRAADETSAAGSKVTNYLSSILAIHDAKGRGAHEALIVDGRGRVVEGASSNVFCIAGGRLQTPPESAGILPGITRAHVLAAATTLAIAVEERDLEPHDVYGADEVFITSSIRELLPVVRVDDRAVGAGVPGAITRALHRAFRHAVGIGDGAMPWE